MLQNVGEAEYVVALFQYMRLCGYPAEKITILTTYNGQKSLLRDVIKKRCAGYPAFGEPARIETVDKYQGQQNDYVLLSLVRTRAVGHLRDVRRLVVALSRARLGLYVFCRAALFSNCYELSQAFAQLAARPTQLELVLGEDYASCTRPADKSLGACVAESGGLLSTVAVSSVGHMGQLVSQAFSAQMMVAASYAMASMAHAANTSAAATASGEVPIVGTAAGTESFASSSGTSSSAGASAGEVEVEVDVTPAPTDVHED
ncbi:MAG: C-terminal helicase domain-containing protein [Rhodocyclaceae bacterium]|nr:C-terminal helicase domain-containing protein [Rhodocyclaceae bacterium]